MRRSNQIQPKTDKPSRKLVNGDVPEGISEDDVVEFLESYTRLHTDDICVQRVDPSNLVAWVFVNGAWQMRQGIETEKDTKSWCRVYLTSMLGLDPVQYMRAKRELFTSNDGLTGVYRHNTLPAHALVYRPSSGLSTASIAAITAGSAAVAGVGGLVLSQLVKSKNRTGTVSTDSPSVLDDVVGSAAVPTVTTVTTVPTEESIKPTDTPGSDAPTVDSEVQNKEGWDSKKLGWAVLGSVAILTGVALGASALGAVDDIDTSWLGDTSGWWGSTDSAAAVATGTASVATGEAAAGTVSTPPVSTASTGQAPIEGSWWSQLFGNEAIPPAAATPGINTKIDWKPEDAVEDSWGSYLESFVSSGDKLPPEGPERDALFAEWLKKGGITEKFRHFDARGRYSINPLRLKGDPLEGYSALSWYDWGILQAANLPGVQPVVGASVAMAAAPAVVETVTCTYKGATLGSIAGPVGTLAGAAKGFATGVVKGVAKPAAKYLCTAGAGKALTYGIDTFAPSFGYVSPLLGSVLGAAVYKLFPY